MGNKFVKEDIKHFAIHLGFDAVGVTSARPLLEAKEALRKWLDHGFAGEMAYMVRNSSISWNPGALMPQARSVICVAMSYDKATRPLGHHRTEPSHTGDALQSSKEAEGNVQTPSPHVQTPSLLGRASCYAWGRDYHGVMKEKLASIASFLLRRGAREARAFVDAAPLLEKALAVRAGIGAFGKNSNVISRGLGSWAFLGEVLTDLELEPDIPSHIGDGKVLPSWSALSPPGGCEIPAVGRDACGRCEACIKACPTGAIVAPYVVDARRCISYLTIELKGSIPEEFRPLMGDRVFGCDICQEVCPHNRTRTRHRPAPPTECQSREEPHGLQEPSSLSPLAKMACWPSGPYVDLASLLTLSEEEFKLRFKGTALARAKRQGLRRNAAVALGNLGNPAAIPILKTSLNDENPVVRSHVAWSLKQLTQ